MKLSFPIAVAVFVLAIEPAHGQRPHLEFVEGLRQRRHADLALEYLEGLSRKPLPPDIARSLPLEIALTRAAVGKSEPDRQRCVLLLKQAGAEYQDFIAKNPQTPRLTEVRLEIARIAALLAKQSFDQASAADRATTRKPLLDSARAQLEAAAAQFRSLLESIDTKLQSPDLPDDERKRLSPIRQNAELDHGINLINLFAAFDDTLSPARTEAAKQAVTVLKQLADRDRNLPIAWQARAWLGRCLFETQDYRTAKRELQTVIDEKNPAAAEGKRLARYFRLLVIEKDGETKDPSAVKLKEAEQWLNDYKAHADTPEGLSVRFQLAEASVDQAKKKSPSDSRRLLDEAERSYGVLERSTTEFARTARERRLGIVYTRSVDRTKGDIGQLKDFQECWLRAQVEIYQRTQEDQSPSKGEKTEEKSKKRDQRLKDLVRALERALDLADASTPASDRDEAQYTLAYLCLTETGDPFRAAILGEELARRDSQSNRASLASGCAIEAYAQLLAEAEANGGRSATVDQERLHRLAERMEKLWPNDPATDHARFHVGNIAIRQKKHAEAIEAFRRVAPTYANYAICQYRLAYAALQAHKQNAQPAEGNPPYQDQAIEALTRIPEAIDHTDPGSAAVYFNGKLELAKLLFANKRFEELGRTAEQLEKTYAVAKPTLDPAMLSEIEPTLKCLPVYAQAGRADVHFRAGRHAEVISLLDPIVRQIKENKFSDLKDTRIVRLIQSLALWSQIQSGNGKEAEDLLKNILDNKTQSDLEATSTVTNELLALVGGRLDELRKKGSDGAADLQRARENFDKFLNAMALESVETRSPEMVRFMAFSYSLLENHAQAADFLGRLPPPSSGDGKASPEKETAYQSFQLLHARELRLARRFDDAQNKLRDILKADWGKKSTDVKKELLSLWEDKGEYQAAARGWNDLMTTVRPQMEQNARLKDLYYECYYHVVYCLCSGAAATADARKKNDDVQKAANWFVKLKRIKHDMGSQELLSRYESLQERAPEFKKACEELMRNTK